MRWRGVQRGTRSADLRNAKGHTVVEKIVTRIKASRLQLSPLVAERHHMVVPDFRLKDRRKDRQRSVEQGPGDHAPSPELAPGRGSAWTAARARSPGSAWPRAACAARATRPGTRWCTAKVRSARRIAAQRVQWFSGSQGVSVPHRGGCCREVRDAKEQTRWPSCTVVPLGKLTLRGDEGHCLALSWSDLSVWCYACDSYIKHNTLEPLLIRAHEIKRATCAAEQFPSTMFCNVL